MAGVGAGGAAGHLAGATAGIMQQPEVPGKTRGSDSAVVYRLLYNKYYVDQIYDAMFVNRTKDLALTLGAFDRGVINGLGVDGAGWLTRVTSRISMCVGLLDRGRAGESGGAHRLGVELSGAHAADRARVRLRAVDGARRAGCSWAITCMSSGITLHNMLH